MIQLPFNSDPRRSFRCNLNGKEYEFATSFNERSEVWAFDLTDTATGTTLVVGQPILLGVDMLEQYGLNIGRLIAVDLNAQPIGTARQSIAAQDAGAEDLGARVVVIYLAPGEVVE